MPQLLDLPSELIAAIFQHLDDDTDFFATRLANRSLETASLTPFGRRFFRKKGYMLTTPSLDVLDCVAKSSKLRKYVGSLLHLLTTSNFLVLIFGRYVQHVWFNPDCYTFISPACAPEEDIECDDAEDESEDEHIEIVQRVDLLSDADSRKWKAYQEVMEDHQNLLDGDATILEKLLEEILSNLPNLKIIGMRRSEDHSPWGWRNLQQAVGEDPRVIGPIPTRPMPFLSDPTKLFKALVSAVATSGTCLQRFYTDAVEVDNMPMNWLRQDTLQTALRSMLYLEINVSKAVLPPSSTPYYRVLRDVGKCGDGLLKVFQAAAPTLLELGLQIFPELRRAHFMYTGYGSDTWKQQSNQYITFDKIVENMRFEHLARLKLEKIVATPESLESFLFPSKDKLTSLKMRDIRLLNSEDGDRPWERVFTFLLSSVPKLDYLLLYQLLYTHGGISFVEKPPRPSSATIYNPNTGTPNPSTPQDLVNTHDAGHFAYVYGDLHAPEARGGGGTFREYEHITLEASGREEVVAKLGKVRERHWYCGNVYSYAMDEEVWHTDTSDEEW